MLYFCPSAKVVTLSFAPSSWTSQAKQVLWSFRSLIRNFGLWPKLLPLDNSKSKRVLFGIVLAYS